MPGLAFAGNMDTDVAARPSGFGFARFGISLGRRRKLQDLVTAGALFRRERPDQMIETARVITVSDDGMGIPHVRYELEIGKRRSATQFKAGTRALALDTFIGTYSFLSS